MRSKENCECLAAWVDSEPCICDEPIGPPMEVNAKKLAEANRIVSQISEIDRALSRLKAEGSYEASIRYGAHNDYSSHVHLRLPADIAAGLLRTMRFQELVKLSQTGVTSTASGYRPVVSA